jgi:3-isopropylmalate/(R)-2-methylmalate dehydratase small subunit
LAAQQVQRPDGEPISFEIDAFRKHCLLNGLDDIGLTLEDADAIHAYEKKRKQSEPWIYIE